MADRDPLPDGGNGRDPKTGRFTNGNPGGPGNPHNKRVLHFRNLIQKATTDDQVKKIWSKLLQEAEAGKPWAVREALDRLIGKADQKVQLSGEDLSEATRQGIAVLMRDDVIAKRIEELERTR